MRYLYNLLIPALPLFMQVAAWFHPKARLWVNGRKQWRQKLHHWRKQHPKTEVLWIHAASLGEFEQGRPVIEAYQKNRPHHKIVLTFFSPSGYEIRKNYPHADLILYLPADTAANARDFVSILQPEIAIFIKYEFWANYLHYLRQNQVNTLLISAVFRKEQVFFKWYGAFWRNMLQCFNWIFIQDEVSQNILQSIGFQNITVAGDTRIDRVMALAAQEKTNPVCAAFTAGSPCFIAGSSWPADEAIYLPVLAEKSFHYLKIIIAPHEPSPSALAQLETQLKQLQMSFVRYSTAEKQADPQARVLIIDNIGLLNTLYPYARIAYIGGGFGKGIHNTLEPAAYGLPVIFGPKYQAFEEARQLSKMQAAFPIQQAGDLRTVLQQLNQNDVYATASGNALDWLQKNRGATDKILHFLTEFD